MKECCHPDGITIKPDGEHELSACHFQLDKRLKNVTIEILVCPKCGKVSIGWYKQENTEDITDDQT